MPELSNTRSLIVLGVLALFGIITFALAAATLGTLNKRWNKLEERLAELTPATTTETPPPSLDSLLAETIQIEDLMRHLEEFEKIAKAEGNTRAIGTPGFTKTVDYIEQYLKENTKHMTTFREQFRVKNFSLNGNPTFSYSINNGAAQSLTYSTDLPQAEFTHVNYSAPIDLTSYELVLVKNNGCNDSDWGDVSGKAVLVIVGGPCTSSDKGQTARNKNAAAVIFYSNGLTTSSLAPSIIRLRQKTDLPALFLSYAAGKKLADALNRNERVNINIEIKVHPYGTFDVENICADTNAGNRNETIVVRSHSDSVPAGPGINDNGSGSAANLVLAKNLDQLYSSGKYSPYRYRVRFCWWGAEEIGLVGSFAHIDNAKSASAAPGNSVKDYLVNLNYDMLGSPNYFFGIYDGNTAKPGTPVKALNGSRHLTDVYRRWFQSQKLFSSLTDFSGRSDYGPFLAEGIVAGGLFSGADDVKTVEERDGLKAGLAGATHDPCYHRDCDTVANIDRYGYLKMVQAAGYMLDYLGRQGDLHQLLYQSNS